MFSYAITDSGGDSFIASTSPAERRLIGATFTPPEIVDAMMCWAKSHGSPRQVVDPGAGSGRFAIAAAKAFPTAEIVAVETNHRLAKILGRNAVAANVHDRVTIIADDYRRLQLPPIDGVTLFLGNPPYVRHHDIAPEWKAWYAATASSLHLPASRLAGLHLHFLLKTRQLARDGDYGTFITAAEWLDVNYGDTLRRLSTNGMGTLSIDVFPADEAVFEGAMTTAAVTCFEIGASPDNIAFGSVRASSGSIVIGRGQCIPSSVLSTTGKWSRFATTPHEAQAQPSGNAVRVGDLFRVKRGQVTGLNSVWIAGEQAANLPSRLLRPTITKARELIECGGALADAGNLRCVVDLPVDLNSLDGRARGPVQRYLEWAASKGADSGYVATHRAAWWSVGLYDPAPIVCTYMGRRPPSFARNLCRARHINIAHGLYPRQPLAPALLDGIVAWLNQNVSREHGRTYAGGLTKFEPREIEQLRLPPLDEFAAA